MAAAAARRKKKPNWIKIRNEYETSNISQQALANKFDVPLPTLKDRSKRESWGKSKKEIHTKIMLESSQNSISHAIDEATAQDNLHNYAFQMVMDALISTMKTKPTAHNVITGEVKEYDYDPKDYDAITKSLERIQKGQRLAKKRMSAFEIERLAIEKLKLEIEARKIKETSTDTDGDETGIVMMPEVDEVESEDVENG